MDFGISREDRDGLASSVALHDFPHKLAYSHWLPL